MLLLNGIMQKGLFFVIVALLLFVISVSAIEVRLREPGDNVINTSSNKIIFKCVGVQIAGETLNSLTLRFKSGDVWYNIETKPASDLQEVSFTYEIPTNGVYKWNCMAKNTLNQVFYAASDYTLTLSKTNMAPVYPRTANNYIPNISWDKNTVKSNALLLDQYFYDPDNDLLTYGTTGNLNIQVNIDPITHLVSFLQPNNWFGIEKVTFIASDGKSSTNSNEITLKVIDTGTQQQQQQNQSSSNVKPQFTDVIPNQTKYKNGGSWTLDLIDYASDDKDSKQQLVWSISGVDSNLLEAVVNNADKNIKFTPKKDKIGKDVVTISVKDSGDLSVSQEINIFILEEETTSNESVEEEIEEENFPPDIDNVLPDNSNNLTLSEEQVFRVSASDQENDPISYIWYLDDVEIKDQKLNVYVLDPNTLDNNTHKLKVSVSDGNSKTSKEWGIQYLAQNNLNETQKVENKTIVALSNSEKITGSFIKDKITGNFVNVKDFIIKWKIPFIIGGVIILLLILFIMIRIIIRRRANSFIPKVKSNGIYTPRKIEDKTLIISKEQSKNEFKKV
jgi:hypothetical protein